ncbi:MAG TPA: CDP-alcohol phosphatidyltransferase family protein [Acidimicrobiales bacterium]|nr:CDP-alcohol phosphatidyltransferase family protein [Acidimicrobiales bacterium]
MRDGFGPSALATPANAITAARLVAAPLMALLIVREGPGWAVCGVWFVLSSTDALDGFLARRHGATRSGAFLDPLADKICVLVAMVTLVAVGTWWWLPVGLIAGRELVQTALRSQLARRGVSVPATRLAKVKTLLQDLAVGAALLPWTAHRHALVQTILWAAVVLTLFTGAQYLRVGRRSAVVA